MTAKNVLYCCHQIAPYFQGKDVQKIHNVKLSNKLNDFLSKMFVSLVEPSDNLTTPGLSLFDIPQLLTPGANVIKLLCP
jgi:hypothetical protein